MLYRKRKESEIKLAASYKLGWDLEHVNQLIEKEVKLMYQEKMALGNFSVAVMEKPSKPELLFDNQTYLPIEKWQMKKNDYAFESFWSSIFIASGHDCMQFSMDGKPFFQDNSEVLCLNFLN